MDTPISPRHPYPTDVSDEEWACVAPDLALVREDAPQRRHELRAVFNALRWIVRAGSPWRLLPTNFPPWEVVYPQTRRWLAAGVFETMAHDWRMLLREAADRRPQPRAVLLASRTVPSPPESEARAGDDGHTKRQGSKTHAPVDTLGHLLALVVTPANAQDRAQAEARAAAGQDVTGESVELAYVDQGYTGEQPDAAAAAHGIRLEIVKLPQAKHGCVLLPRRWVMARSFAWAARFRRLARDYERLPATVVGLPFPAFACLLLHRPIPLLAESP
jgi:transposase